MNFNNLKILVVGDVMIDRYLTGNVHRISPEAPVPIVHFQKEENRLGGAANVALNLSALGATPFLCSVIGSDENARLFLELMPKNELLLDGIRTSKSRQTTVKTRVLAGSQQMLRVDREDTHNLDDKEEFDLLENIKKLLQEQLIDAIILQDYNKGVLTPTVIEQIIVIAKTQQIPVVVDPKKKHFFAYKSVALFKPNLKEVRESVPFDVLPTIASLQQAADYLRQKLQHQCSMITLSEKGIFIENGTESLIVPTQARNIADVCGAGDTVVSISALAVALDMDMDEIALLGNLAGGQVCEKVGVVPVDKAQLMDEYKAIKTTFYKKEES